MTERFALVNIGRLGKAGESSFSTMGIPCATKRIEDGWIPCGTHVTPEGDVYQTFYLPMGVAAPASKG